MSVRILLGDVRERLRGLPAESVHCVVTSPPYWGLRDYGVPGQLGLEPTLGEHIAAMVDVFREVRRVLRPDGVCFVNYGDCYATQPNGRSAAEVKALGEDDRTFRDKPFSTVGPVHGALVADYEKTPRGGATQNLGNLAAQTGPRVVAGGYLKPKDLCMVPQRFAIAMQDDGWWVRSVLPWVKRNAMPESVHDRPATATEWVFMFTKASRYFWDATAVRRRAVEPSAPLRVSAGWAVGEGGHDAISHNRGPRADKQRGHSRRHAGFNDRWDAMERAEQTANGRNFRNADLFFDSIDPAFGIITDADGLPLALDVAPQPFAEAHFATFPPKLIEPLIRAATSAKGVCPCCGAPWVRKVEVGYSNPGNRSTNGPRSTERRHETAGFAVRLEKVVETTGWEPSCVCADNIPVPATVLDPFGGAGTTGLVADGMQRDAILTELNPEYAEIARARIAAAAAGLFAAVHVDDGFPPRAAE